MDALKKRSPTARSGFAGDLAICVRIDSNLGSTADQHTAILAIKTQTQSVVGGAE